MTICFNKEENAQVGSVEHEQSRRKSDTQTAGMDPVLHNNVK